MTRHASAHANRPKRTAVAHAGFGSCLQRIQCPWKNLQAARRGLRRTGVAYRLFRERMQPKLHCSLQRFEYRDAFPVPSFTALPAKPAHLYSSSQLSALRVKSLARPMRAASRGPNGLWMPPIRQHWAPVCLLQTRVALGSTIWRSRTRIFRERDERHEEKPDECHVRALCWTLDIGSLFIC